MPQTGCICTHIHTNVVDQPALWLPLSLGSPTLAALSCWGIPLTFCRCNKLSEPTRVHTQIHQYWYTHVHIYACICVTSTNFDSHYVFRLRPPFLRLCFVSPFLFCGFIFQLAVLFDRVKRNGPKIKWREMEFELFQTIETVLFVSLYSSLLLFFVHLLYLFYLPHVLFLCAQPFYAFVPRLSCSAPSWRTIFLHRV